MGIELSERELMRWLRKVLNFSPRDFKTTPAGTYGFGVELLGQTPTVGVAFPFRIATIPPLSGDVADNIRVKIVDGTVGGVTPEIDDDVAGLTPINEFADSVPSFLLSRATAKDPGYNFFFKIFVYPSAQNLGTDDLPFYVVGGGTVTGDPADPDPLEIIFAEVGDDPDDGSDAIVNKDTGDATTGLYYRRIATWFGADLISQPIETSLDFTVCNNGDDSDGNSLARLVLGRD